MVLLQLEENPTAMFSFIYFSTRKTGKLKDLSLAEEFEGPISLLFEESVVTIMTPGVHTVKTFSYFLSLRGGVPTAVWNIPLLTDQRAALYQISLSD